MPDLSPLAYVTITVTSLSIGTDPAPSVRDAIIHWHKNPLSAELQRVTQMHPDDNTDMHRNGRSKTHNWILLSLSCNKPMTNSSQKEIVPLHPMNKTLRWESISYSVNSRWPKCSQLIWDGGDAALVSAIYFNGKRNPASSRVMGLEPSR